MYSIAVMEPNKLEMAELPCPEVGDYDVLIIKMKCLLSAMQLIES